MKNDFALGNDHSMLLQGRGESGFPPNSGPVLQGGGGIRGNTVCNDSRTADAVSYGKGGSCALQVQKNDVAVPMSAEARLFPADGCAGIGDGSDVLCSPRGDAARPLQDEHKNRGSDLFLFDWPDARTWVPWRISRLASDAQLVPSTTSCFDNDPNSSTAANKTGASPILIDLTVPVPDTTTDQINMATPIGTQQISKNTGRDTPLVNCSSSEEEIEQFPPLSEADIFCPFDDMLVPASPSKMCSSTTLSGPDDFFPATKKKKPHTTTPDMILDEMAGNPLEMYFPPLTMYKQPEAPMSDASSSTTQMQQQLLPEGYFAGEGAADLNGAGSQFGPRESLGFVKAAPVKHPGFQKLQEGMNQLDVGAKTCIRDALYRLANSVERRHSVDQAVGSSGAANRFKTSSVVWT